MRLKGGCVGLCVAALATLACLALVETTLRLFAPQALLHDPDAFLPDAVLGVRLKPGFTDRVVTTEFASTWKINARGYRGPIAPPRSGAGIRIVALGDSFTFGYGVEEQEAWPRQVETLLNEGRAPGRTIDVVNLGVGGYGTHQETLWLEETWPELRPDLAVVGFYVGNDPADNARAESRGAVGAPRTEGTPASDDGATRTEALKRWLGSRLHLYTLVSTRTDDLLVRLGLRRIVYPFEMDVLLDDEPPRVTAAWSATRAAFEKLAAFGREHAITVMVAIIPMKHQVSDRVWERLVAYHEGQTAAGSRGAAFVRDRPQTILASICRETELTCLDLREGLVRSLGAGEDASVLYWPRDQHWNARGHAAAARVIEAWLQESGRFEPSVRGTGSR